MKYIPKVSMMCFLSMLYISNSFGQTVQNDTAFLANAQTQTVAKFNKLIGEQSRLYSGREYPPYDPIIKGNAYYPDAAQTWANGEVTYDGITYKDVPIIYDINKDVVISLLYNKFSKYTFVNERVHDFTFSFHHFVRVEIDSLKKNSSGINTGFYEQLYAGRIEVLAKREKSIQVTSNTNTYESYFTEVHNYYYLKKDDAYYRVSGEGSFLDSFSKDKRIILKRYIKDNKIKFNKDPEQAMVKIAAYYDHLNN